MVDSATPVFDLSSSEARPHTEGDLERPPRRPTGTIVALALGVIVLLIGLSVFGGGNDEDDSADEAPPSTTASTTRPPNSSTTSTLPHHRSEHRFVDGPWADAPAGLGVVIVDHDGVITVVNLETGEHHVTEHSDLGSVARAMWFDGSLATVGARGNELLRLAPDESGEWIALDMPNYQIEPGWMPGEMLWAWPRTGEGSSGVVVPGDDGGLELIEPPPGSIDLQGVGVIDQRVVFVGSDGIFVLGTGEVPHRLAYGRVIGIGGPYLVRTDCDEQLQCRLVREKLAQGRLDPTGRADLGPSSAHWAIPAPDGRAVALVEYGFSAKLRIVALDGEAGFEVDVRQIDDPRSMRWTDDGDALVWLANSGRSVNVVRVWGDGSVGEVLTRTLGLPSQPSQAGVILVPIDEVPPSLVAVDSSE